ncbi:hypothetical protein DBV15_12433 [Temnothorax longispinosus]|uniref:CCHC-type domain-containing protein n=1 Tax=Temnothorax longispinosus TaxID=300112 RepID=A0A4S2KLH2_9HYME|nr:hypothetical protein DBV15_12433 [Temnothorax longispinosus]
MEGLFASLAANLAAKLNVGPLGDQKQDGRNVQPMVKDASRVLNKEGTKGGKKGQEANSVGKGKPKPSFAEALKSTADKAKSGVQENKPLPPATGKSAGKTTSAAPVKPKNADSKGHVRAQCTSAIDRSSRCYRCGNTDHLARECNAAPKCPVCTDLGKPAGHRTGGKACAFAKKRAKPKKAASTARPNSQPARGDERMKVKMADEDESSRPLPQIMSVESVSISILIRQSTKRSASTGNGDGEAEDTEDRLKARRRRKERGQATAQTTPLLPDFPTGQLLIGAPTDPLPACPTPVNQPEVEQRGEEEPIQTALPEEGQSEYPLKVKFT